MSESRIFICSDGHKLAYNLWMPENKDAKAFVQIIHTVAECSDKYEHLAKYLNKKGYAVFGADLRGHGNTADENEKYVFAEKDGWNRVCEDSFEIARYVSKLYHAKQIFLVGYELGSLIARTVISQHPDFFYGIAAVSTKSGFSLKEKMHNLSVKFLRRSAVIGENIEITYSMYCDIVYGTEVSNAKTRISQLPKDLPVLLLGGAAAPVRKDVESVYSLYKNAGITDVCLKVFDNGPHDLLHWVEKKAVYDYIWSWLEKHI